MLDVTALESPDYILHLGDKCTDCECIVRMFPTIPLRAVRGNCDSGISGLDMDAFTLEGRSFFMTHGHLFNVKMGKTRIIDAAVKRGVDILLFGHTHTPFYETKDGLTILNPGCVGLNQKYYAIIELNNGAVECELKSL
jgi:hypothetical protein